jgi:hypothetical protein
MCLDKHAGIDIQGESGDIITSSVSGKVVYAGEKKVMEMLFLLTQFIIMKISKLVMLILNQLMFKLRMT